MTTQERHGPPFDTPALGAAFRTRPATVHDVAYGEGQLFSAGRGAARLEIFPQTRVTRLTTRDVRVELFGTTIASVSPGGVEFHREHPGEQTSLALIPGGGLVFTFVAGGEHTPPPPSRSEEGPGRPLPAVGQQPESNPETAPAPEKDSADPHPLAPVVQLPARPLLPAGSAPTSSTRTVRQRSTPNRSACS